MSNATVNYEVRVCVAKTWAGGNMRGTRMVTVSVTEDATILGGCRAIDKAVEQYEGRVILDHSPDITPNPAAEGWPVS